MLKIGNSISKIKHPIKSRSYKRRYCSMLEITSEVDSMLRKILHVKDFNKDLI